MRAQRRPAPMRLVSHASNEYRDAERNRDQNQDANHTVRAVEQ